MQRQCQVGARLARSWRGLQQPAWAAKLGAVHGTQQRPHAWRSAVGPLWQWLWCN